MKRECALFALLHLCNVKLTMRTGTPERSTCNLLHTPVSFPFLFSVSQSLPVADANYAHSSSQLRKFVKATTVDRFRKQVKQLIDAAERNADFVGRRRDAVTFSPKDATAVKSFLQVRGSIFSKSRMQFCFACPCSTSGVMPLVLHSAFLCHFLPFPDLDY